MTSNKRDNERSLGLRQRADATYADKSELLARNQELEAAQQHSIIRVSDGKFCFRDFELSSTALVKVPENAKLTDYDELGFALAGLDSASRFWIGDWANLYTVGMSDDETSAVYEKLAEEFNLEASTIKDRAYVCRHVDASLRNDAPSFSHCKAVAGLTPDEQVYWLQEAVRNKWGVARLRREIGKVDDVEDTVPTYATSAKKVKSLDSELAKMKKQDREKMLDELQNIINKYRKPN